MTRAATSHGTLAVAAGLIALACGGSGPDPGPGTCENVAGVWATTEQVNAVACGNGTYGEAGSYTVTQNGCSLTVVSGSGHSFTGAISGSQLSWTGSYPDAGGTVTITSMSLTVAPGGGSFSGSASWTWSGGGTSCSGSTSIQGTRSGGGGASPAPPSGLSATALSASAILLQWTDAATNESGFTVQRASSCNGSFTTVATKAANAQSHQDGGLSPSTFYCYRVIAFNAAGNSSPSNTAGATTQSAPSYTLTVNKAGNGSGTVTGPSISCGATCSAAFAGGTQVTLSASAAGGSSFAGWSGCDSASGASCTVAMTQNRTVVATFSAVLSTSITLASLASPDTDGTYTLSWTVTGLAATPWTIQESPNAGFASYTTYLSYDTTSPYTYSFAGKADGTYCYRVGLSGSGPFSNVVCVTVARPSTAVLRIVNNMQYDMIDVRLNGQQMVSYPYGIASGASADFTFAAGGAVSVQAGVGFYTPGGQRDVWFTCGGGTTVTAGQTTTFTCNAITIAQLLTNFSASGAWVGSYYCYTCPTIFHQKRFTFTSGGSWTLANDGAFESSGSVALVSWPKYATVVTFRLCPTCANIQLAYPFGTFLYRNGPPDWPTIEYVRQ